MDSEPTASATYYDDAAHAPAPQDPQHYEQPYYADGPAYAQGYAGDPAHSEYDPADTDDAHEPPRERRRGGLITIAAVLGLAVIGTAGAFGYRMMTGPSSSGQPPVIKADAGPNKIVPAPQATDAQSKLVYDRVNKPQDVKVVSREEQPLEMRDAKPAGPKMVMPNGGASTGTPIANGATPPAAAGATAPNLNEPKKVKTLAIRPDGSVAPESATPRSQTTGTATSAAARMPPARPAATAPAQPSQGPLAIAPQTQIVDPVRPPTGMPTRTAALPAGSGAGVPATAGAAAAGTHVVQLASQKSEGDAQASFRALQAKYPNVLGSRQPMIRRVDLGDKGVYYRAQVGPFANAEQANEWCGNLKSAGGQCIVQRN
jgi:hypothetical protein